MTSASVPSDDFVAAKAQVGALSRYARKKKITYFLDPIPQDAKVLEIGAGSGWVGDYFRARGVKVYVGIDLFPPADIVGDIRKWPELGLQGDSFDYIIA